MNSTSNNLCFMQQKSFDLFDVIERLASDNRLVRSNPAPGTVVSFRGTLGLVLSVSSDVSVTIIALGRIHTAHRLPDISIPKERLYR